LNPELIAFGAGALAALGACDGLLGAVRPAARGMSAALAWLASLREPLEAVRVTGRIPPGGERRRLIVAGAAIGTVAGLFAAGPLGAPVGAPVGAALTIRALAARNARYVRAVTAGAGEIASALADAISGGCSVRGAIGAAAGQVRGPAGAELCRVAAELELGAATDSSLAAMRVRAGSPEIDAIVTALLLQRRAGGDLAGLLRGLARSFEDQSRLVGEMRAATAQARFTSVVVIFLPVVGTVLAELASPGFIGGLLEDPVSLWLVGAGLALQLIGAVVIRRLARPTL
jgi:tight adherence protein B